MLDWPAGRDGISLTTLTSRSPDGDNKLLYDGARPREPPSLDVLVVSCRSFEHCYDVQVWAGNEACEPVTWQECKLVPKNVKFIVPEINCTDGNELWYHEPEVVEDVRMTNTFTCEARTEIYDFVSTCCQRLRAQHLARPRADQTARAFPGRSATRCPSPTASPRW